MSELEKLQNESADAAKVEVEGPSAPAAGEAAPAAARGKTASAEKAADEDAPASADAIAVSAPASNGGTTDEGDSGKAVSDPAPAGGDPARKKRRWPKRVALVLVIVVFLGAMGFGAYTGNYYHAGDEAEAELAAWEAGDVEVAAALASDAGAAGNSGATANANAATSAAAASSSPAATASQYVTAAETSSAITVGSAQSEYGLVIYPGAKVDPAAYVPLACKLASQGVYCIIAKMPFNFAFFDMDAAGDLMSAASYVKHWWISGHSLGGVMAAYYACSNADKFEGIALLAAYSTANLTDSGLKTLVIYGTEDGVLNKSKLTDNADKLPADTQTLVIEGGNHAGYGDYGPQQKDGEATISADDQQQQTANAIAAAMHA